MFFSYCRILTVVFCLLTSFVYAQTPVDRCTSGEVDDEAEDGILVDGECGILNSAVTTVSGNIEVKGNGELTLAASITEITGNIVIESDATLTINGDLLDISGSITNNGTLVITGSVTAEGKLEVKGGGETTLDGGSFESTSDGITIESSAVVNLTNGSSITGSSGTSNEGTINADDTGNSVTGGVSGSGTVDEDLGSCTSDCSDGVGLPVELIHFEAAHIGHQVVLSWTTATERDNDYFMLEKSTNGTDFTAIAKIGGHGTTNQPQQYRFADDVGNAFCFYRLKQVDFDGKFDYSPVIWFEPGNSAFRAGPNPIVQGVDRLQLSVEATGREVKALLYDQSGKVLYSEYAAIGDLEDGLNSVLLNCESGIYILSLGYHRQKLLITQRP